MSSCAAEQATQRIVRRRLPQVLAKELPAGCSEAPLPVRALSSISTIASLDSDWSTASTIEEDDSTAAPLSPHSVLSDETCDDGMSRCRTPSPERTWQPRVPGRCLSQLPPPPAQCFFLVPCGMMVPALPVAIAAAPAAQVIAAPVPVPSPATPLEVTPRAEDSEQERCLARSSSQGLPHRPSWADQMDEEEAEAERVEAPSTCLSCAPDAASLPSVGSADHGHGCRPCAHIFKPEGCTKGHACTYCHLCGREDFLAYKRQYKIDRAIAKHERRRQMAEAAEAEAAAAAAAHC